MHSATNKSLWQLKQFFSSFFCSKITVSVLKAFPVWDSLKSNAVKIVKVDSRILTKKCPTGYKQRIVWLYFRAFEREEVARFCVKAGLLKTAAPLSHTG